MSIRTDTKLLNYFEGTGRSRLLDLGQFKPKSRGKISTFFRFMGTNSSLHREGKLTIHCKDENDFDLVKEIAKDKDVYVLRAFNSFTIFLKEMK